MPPSPSGTLYLSYFLGDLIAVDLNDLTAVPTTLWDRDPDMNTTQVHVLPEQGEFVYSTKDFVLPDDDGVPVSALAVVVRDLDDRSVRTQFPWGVTTEEGDFVSPSCLSAVDPSPDGQLFIAVAWYDQSCTDNAAYIDIQDRTGKQVTDFDRRAFADWTWTPDGDLLVILTGLELTKDGEPTGDTAALGVMAREDLLAGDPQAATILQTFPGDDETPTYPVVSAAGDQIAYSYAGQRSGELYVVPFENGAEPRLVAVHDKSLQWADFSPDGSELVVAAYEYRQVGKDNRSTVRIPNDPAAPPITLSGNQDYVLEVPQVEGGPPKPLDVQGPFAWR